MVELGGGGFGGAVAREREGLRVEWLVGRRAGSYILGAWAWELRAGNQGLEAGAWGSKVRAGGWEGRGVGWLGGGRVGSC